MTSTSSTTRGQSAPGLMSWKLFAGAANITRRCQKFHLSAASPIDFNTGWDLRKAADQDQVDGILDDLRPLILIQGIDCKDWCLLQDNCNYVRRKILLLMKRAKARAMLRKTTSWCKKQALAGRLFLIENPITSRLWLEPAIQRLRHMPCRCIRSHEQPRPDDP